MFFTMGVGFREFFMKSQRQAQSGVAFLGLAVHYDKLERVLGSG